jgi:phosphorylcholine metabolism protein LicD
MWKMPKLNKKIIVHLNLIDFIQKNIEKKNIRHKPSLGGPARLGLPT